MYAKDKTSIVDRREMLRIKVNSLAAEARIIRRAERKAWGELRNELTLHRRGVVRVAARETHLALGLIKGRTIQQMERKAFRPPDWKAVEKMVRKYGPVAKAAADELVAKLPVTPEPFLKPALR